MSAPETLPFAPKLADPADQYRKQFGWMHWRRLPLAGFDVSTSSADLLSAANDYISGPQGVATEAPPTKPPDRRTTFG